MGLSEVEDICYVYWIRLPEHRDMTKEGYIGISNNPIVRLENHIKDCRRRKYRTEFKNSLQSGNYVFSILICSTRKYCLDLEFKLRPDWSIGWNLCPGGEGPSYLKRVHNVGGKMYAISELAQHFGVKLSTIEGRLYLGWTPEEAVGYKIRKPFKKEIPFECYVAEQLLWNTPKTLYEVGRESGLGLHISRSLSTYMSIPRWLLTHCELLDGNGVKARKLKRNRTFSDFETILEIESKYCKGQSVYSLAKEFRVSDECIRNLLRDLDAAEYF